jgi:hypothetical protein
MGDYINGYGKPKFKVFNKTGLVEEITLPACSSEGEPEEYEREGLIFHKTLKGKLVPVNINEDTYRIKWTLKYNRHISGSGMMDLMKVINYGNQPAAYRLVMIPYDDMPSREFEVLLTSQNFSVDIQKGRQNAGGMYVTDLEFATISLYNLNWIPSEESV